MWKSCRAVGSAQAGLAPLGKGCETESTANAKANSHFKTRQTDLASLPCRFSRQAKSTRRYETDCQSARSQFRPTFTSTATVRARGWTEHWIRWTYPAPHARVSPNSPLLPLKLPSSSQFPRSLLIFHQPHHPRPTTCEAAASPMKRAAFRFAEARSLAFQPAAQQR